MCTCTCKCAHTCIRLCVCTCAHACMQAYISIHTRRSRGDWRGTRICGCTCAHACMRACISVHTHICTHTQELRGLAGPRAPRLCLEAYIAGRSAFIGADRSKSYLVFPAKNKCSEWKGGLVTSGAGGGGVGGAAKQETAEGEAHMTAFFPVSVLVTAIGDGVVARDISSKLRDRLEQVLHVLCIMISHRHVCMRTHMHTGATCIIYYRCS